MIYLCFQEFGKFTKTSITSEMLADVESDSSHLTINIDLIMHNIPCSIISFDVQDTMGTHSSNFENKIIKYRVNQDKKVIDTFKDNFDTNQQLVEQNYEKTKESMVNKEGCWLIGKVDVLRVPGSFHVSTFSHAAITNKLRNEGFNPTNLSHTINHISFGAEDDIKNIKQIFNTGILNPIDGTIKSHDEQNTVDEYYLSVVPTSYLDLDGNLYKAHQFISNSNTLPVGSSIQALYFRFDLSPIMVKYIMQKERIHYFLVEICAIVGGIYTVTSVLLSFILNSYYTFIKDKQK